MEMRIQTKWGRVLVNPESIHEVNIRMNPFENFYRMEFFLDGGQRIHADFSSGDELSRTFKSVTNKMDIVRQYKYWDGYTLQINEPKRIKLKSKLNEPED